ncbi:hypothetical protein TUM17570_28360 [Enterobacter cloacae]|nr:hypothetical protein TUM17570_28360 [Enterobacter cloacae]
MNQPLSAVLLSALTADANDNCPIINNKIRGNLIRTITMPLPYLVFGADLNTEYLNERLTAWVLFLITIPFLGII